MKCKAKNNKIQVDFFFVVVFAAVAAVYVQNKRPLTDVNHI